MAGPLSGVKILEFSQIIAAPFSGMLLADMGADVIKVEHPDGEPWRLNQQIVPKESKSFIALNRGKRSLPLDMTQPQALKIVHQLLPEVDVVLINYRPDVPQKLGIDYESLAAINPRIIYCENTAYGRRGPESLRPGYDIIIQAMSGLMAADGKIQDGVPQQVTATAVADFSAGMSMVWAICAALYHREKSGIGQKIEASLLASALAIQTGRFTVVDMTEGESRQEFIENLGHLRNAGAPYEETHGLLEGIRARPPGNIYYNTFQTADNVIAVACLSNSLRKKMADALDLYDIRFEPDYDPQSDKAREFGEALSNKAKELFTTKTTAEWIKILDRAGVPCGPVKFTEELIQDEQVKANELVVDLDHPKVGKVTMVGPAVRMSETPLQAINASPTLGQHTSEILSSLGYDDETIKQLIEDGITTLE